MHDDEHPSTPSRVSGPTRRNLLITGAKVGGAVAWSVPMVQMMSQRPAAAAGTPAPGTTTTTTGGGGGTTTTTRPANPGTGTPGYWKTHPEAWPVSSITLGGVTYTKAQAIQIIQDPPSGDYSDIIYSHLAAAKLNVLIGNDNSCVADAIVKGDQFLSAFPIGAGLQAGEQAAWDSYGSAAATTLDDYNNGRLCAPPRT